MGNKIGKNVYENHCWYEDFAMGDVFEFGRWDMTREEMLDFARQYDPEPFHVDEEEAKRLGWGGLIASGLQITAICRRSQNAGFPNLEVVISPGWDKISWFKPVFVGDVLSCLAKVVEIKPLSSRPGEGLVKLDIQMRLQDGEKIAQMITNWFLRLKPQS
ncbi:MAG: acyl dehydratase [Proteobacteria bacterium]|nr:acyl dehydratase [Pseudomonadota bacterium]